MLRSSVVILNKENLRLKREAIEREKQSRVEQIESLKRELDEMGQKLNEMGQKSRSIEVEKCEMEKHYQEQIQVLHTNILSESRNHENEIKYYQEKMQEMKEAKNRLESEVTALKERNKEL